MIPTAATTRYFVILSFLFLSKIVNAQTGTVSGKVTDEKDEPLTGAVAELRSASDSSLAKADAADVNGVFSFLNVKPGDYYLKTSLLGFNTFTGNVFSFDGSSSKEIPLIKMASSTTTLKQAEVAAIKPLI